MSVKRQLLLCPQLFLPASGEPWVPVTITDARDTWFRRRHASSALCTDVLCASHSLRALATSMRGQETLQSPVCIT